MGKLYNSSAPSVIFRLEDLNAEEKILLFQLCYKYKDKIFDNSEYNLIAYITGIPNYILGNVFLKIKNLGYIIEYKDWDDNGKELPFKYKVNYSKIEQYAKPTDFVKETNNTPIVKLTETNEKLKLII